MAAARDRRSSSTSGVEAVRGAEGIDRRQRRLRIERLHRLRRRIPATRTRRSSRRTGSTSRECAARRTPASPAVPASLSRGLAASSPSHDCRVPQCLDLSRARSRRSRAIRRGRAYSMPRRVPRPVSCQTAIPSGSPGDGAPKSANLYVRVRCGTRGRLAAREVLKWPEAGSACSFADAVAAPGRCCRPVTDHVARRYEPAGSRQNHARAGSAPGGPAGALAARRVP